MLLIVISAGAVPAVVLGYRESQFEVQSGNLLIQDQAYTTAPIQTLFHSQMAAGTDAEAFDFGRTPDGSIGLAQTNAAAADATDTGFYRASFSFLKFDNPTSTGFLHTPIGDPIHTTTPVFSSLIWPQMTKVENKVSPGMQPAANISKPNVTVNQTAANASAIGDAVAQTANVSTLNDTMRQSAGSLSDLNGSLNTAKDKWAAQAPVIRKEVSTDVGVPGRLNVLALPTATPAPSPTPAPVTNATNATTTPKPTPTPGPTTVLPKADTLLVKPMARQSNKPFTEPLDPDYNPRKASREQIQNISGWDRFTTNVIGRSGIDSTYQNRTSYPSYINPWNSIKLADQYKVMSDSMNMTKTDSWLNPRMWAL